MPTPDRVPGKNCLRQERRQRNWRQSDLAEQLGVSVITVQRWERGIQRPGPYFQLKLAALFGKSAEELGVGRSVLGPVESQEDGAGHVPPSSPLAVTPRLWNVPIACNPHFTGRDDLLEHLHRQLTSSSASRSSAPMRRAAALTQAQAIKGPGGIGKTQIAVEYAYRARDLGYYTHILWINAATSETLLTSVLALAQLLPSVSARGETEQGKLVALVKGWLEECEQRWLLIMDNADDLSLLRDILPQRGSGSLLLTTRAHAVGTLAASLEVGAMGWVEGMELLVHRAGRQEASEEERNEALNIVIALDSFPLALDQAGAYIEETGCGFADYLSLYQQKRQALLARRGKQASLYPDSVATTWSLSFQRVEQANPAAAELLRLCAFLSPDRIPEELLVQGAEHWPALLQEGVADPLAFNQLVEDLLAYSLVKRLTDEHLLSVHRLVQVVQREMMGPIEQSRWAERVIHGVHALFPADPRATSATWPVCLRYLEQAQACDGLIEQYQLELPAASALLERTGIYLHEHASYALAEALFKRALHIRERLPESEPDQVASVLTNLARLYRDQSKYEQAEPLYLRAMRTVEESLGPEHVQVASVLASLGYLYLEQGRYEQAEFLYLRALRIAEESLGPEHVQVANVLNNLAILYKYQGKDEQAEFLYLRSLRIEEESLGPEHPHVVGTLTNLAILYKNQEKYEQAEPLYQRALSIHEKTLGPEHPHIARVLANLAGLYHKKGQYEQAEPLYQRALRLTEGSLGPEHPHVAIVLNNLAELFCVQKRYEQAEPLYQRALRIREESLGSEHPRVASVLANLADLSRAQGQDEQAESLYQRALAIQQPRLGLQHPDTVKSLAGLALVREKPGHQK